MIRGEYAHPQTLRDAGAGDADLLVAVTNSDEVNMIACQIAYTLFLMCRPKLPVFAVLIM